MQRIASAGVLFVALALSLLAIGKLNTGPVSGSTTSSDDVVSVAANGDPAPAAEFPIVGQEALVRVFGQVAVETTGTAFAAVNVPPVIDSRRPTRPPATTTTASPTTTTTPGQDPPTTTTILPTTTTTRALNTTTTALPATTTTVAQREGPSGGHFTTLLRGIVENGPHEFWWDAPYLRSLPFAASTGWTDGDRSGYRCFYAFLQNQEQVVGRVTFTRVPEAGSYASINDRYMVSGERYYDGSLAPEGASKELGDCPAPSTAYAPATGSDQRPSVTYTLGGTLLEVRNYKNTVVGAGITFRQVESTDTRVTVVAYKDNLPAIVIYYDSMVPGMVIGSDLG